MLEENDFNGEGKAAFVFNADESRFHSDPSRLRALGEKGKSLYSVSGRSGRASTTVLACVNGNGSCLPPVIVYKGAAVQLRNAFPESLHTTLKQDWMEEPVSSMVQNGILTFYYQIREHKKCSQQKVLLSYDGRCSHTSVHLVEEALKNNVLLIKLPSHLTDRLQPLDKAVFGSLKTSWEKNRGIRQGSERLTKEHSVELLGTVWSESIEESMKSKNIISDL